MGGRKIRKVQHREVDERRFQSLQGCDVQELSPMGLEGPKGHARMRQEL